MPPAHGAWLAGRIPGVDAQWLDEDGHGSLADRHILQAHAWLAGRR